MNEHIKSIIDNKGLIHKFVAEKANIPRKSFSAAMNGRRRITVEELVRLSQVLDVTLDELVREVQQ